ncbi:hypothetical protein K458DRAFT_424730 [Lentithecium fluviatile CBS 122367]|uniref:Uncharacterized protein n=1 Tax=Lentithecium fluviatile CBS 122367 TaxID=1168545 RepID=A0A6G1IDW0_9PLEO|nr:hypothetical protein K458DRAFT_424730 [Lentithecium fluviatile CBS 122367]
MPHPQRNVTHPRTPPGTHARTPHHYSLVMRPLRLQISNRRLFPIQPSRALGRPYAESTWGVVPGVSAVTSRMVCQSRKLDPVECPLCGYWVEEPRWDLDGHFVGCVRAFALRCLPWGTGGGVVRCGGEEAEKGETEKVLGLSGSDGGNCGLRIIALKTTTDSKTTSKPIREQRSPILSRH